MLPRSCVERSKSGSAMANFLPFRFYNLLDAIAVRRANRGVEDRHAVQDIGERHCKCLALANGAGKGGKLGGKHIEAGMLAHLIGRSGNGAGGWFFRTGHEAEPLQGGPGDFRESLGAVKREAEIRRGG